MASSTASTWVWEPPDLVLKTINFGSTRVLFLPYQCAPIVFFFFTLHTPPLSPRMVGNFVNALRLFFPVHAIRYRKAKRISWQIWIWTLNQGRSNGVIEKGGGGTSGVRIAISRLVLILSEIGGFHLLKILAIRCFGVLFKLQEQKTEHRRRREISDSERYVHTSTRWSSSRISLPEMETMSRASVLLVLAALVLLIFGLAVPSANGQSPAPAPSSDGTLPPQSLSLSLSLSAIFYDIFVSISDSKMKSFSGVCTISVMFLVVISGAKNWCFFGASLSATRRRSSGWLFFCLNSVFFFFWHFKNDWRRPVVFLLHLKIFHCSLLMGTWASSKLPCECSFLSPKLFVWGKNCRSGHWSRNCLRADAGGFGAHLHHPLRDKKNARAWQILD